MISKDHKIIQPTQFYQLIFFYLKEENMHPFAKPLFSV